jgi:taurine dioxygenase
MLRIDSLNGPFGVRITGLDLSRPLTKEESDAIDEAWQTEPLLVFPDQAGLPTEAQAELVGRFATVIEERMPGDLHSFVSNEAGHGTDDMTEGYREGPLTPHMDYTYTPYPADVISLFALSVPTDATYTRFYSNVRPLEIMPPAFREALRAYTIFCAHDLSQMRPDARLIFDGRTDPNAPTQSHTWPLIRRHPKRAGVEALTCTLQQTERIIELSNEREGDPESRAVLARVFDDFLYTRDNDLRHRWRSGDLLIWDNLALQHARDACPRALGPRTLRRVAGCDGGNAIAETVAFLGLQDASVAFS